MRILHYKFPYDVMDQQCIQKVSNGGHLRHVYLRSLVIWHKTKKLPALPTASMPTMILGT